MCCPDWPAAGGAVEGCTCVVLTGQPWAVQWKDVHVGLARLVISEDTHTGQIFPWVLFTYMYGLGDPPLVGLYQSSPGVFVYVSPSSLFYLVPFRHYRPELTLFTLKSA